eukprot:5543413-Pyramimonas_sp.AAC.1
MMLLFRSAVLAVRMMRPSGGPLGIVSVPLPPPLPSWILRSSTPPPTPWVPLPYPAPHLPAPARSTLLPVLATPLAGPPVI